MKQIINLAFLDKMKMQGSFAMKERKNVNSTLGLHSQQTVAFNTFLSMFTSCISTKHIIEHTYILAM